jgi:hypothetical protein
MLELYVLYPSSFDGSFERTYYIRNFPRIYTQFVRVYYESVLKLEQERYNLAIGYTLKP